MYVRADLLDDELVSEFVAYILNNMNEHARSLGFVPLSESLQERVVIHIENRIVGTHFLNRDGNRLNGSLDSLYDPMRVIGDLNPRD